MPKPKLHRWRISRIRGTPAEFIGYVEAPNEAEAIKQAIKQFEISDPEKQKRLVAQRIDYTSATHFENYPEPTSVSGEGDPIPNVS
jgi:hypothetical protein